MLSEKLTALVEGILLTTFTDEAEFDEESVDKPYLQRVSTQFLPFPPIGFNEVHIEYGSSKKL